MSFQPSEKFDGARVGYVFKKDSEGVGYYLDSSSSSSSTSPSATTTTNNNTSSYDNNTEQEEEEAYNQQDTSNMSARQRRLLKLRLKMNKARKANHQEILSEGRRLTDPKYKQRKRKMEERKRHEEWEKSITSKGLAKDQHHMLTTANRAAREEEAAERKRAKKGAFGWEAFNAENLLKGHEKRAAAAMNKRRMKGDTSIGGSNSSDGPALLGDVPSSSAIDNMVGELDDREKLRSKWSRRREVYAGQDINYINEYNRTYNNRINRAYDKYTVDIRQSLERGTG
jgi:pre-mRNA-splicing factor SYF2